MMRISSLALVAAVAAVGTTASTAFAQSLETRTAANTLGLHTAQLQWSAPQTRRSFVRRNGLRAFDMAPASPGGVYDPALTGGGSAGYNEYIGKDNG